ITTEEEKGNKIIAKFMGWESGLFENLPNKLHRMEKGELIGISIHHLRYHISWDCLMPVVEKIGREEYTDDSWRGCEKYENTPYLRTFGMRNSANGKYMVRFNAMPLFEADTLIEATWLAVVDYIQSQKQTS